MTPTNNDRELTEAELEHVSGGLTISKVSDASSPNLLTTVGTGPSPPKSIDVFQFVQAFA